MDVLTLSIIFLIWAAISILLLLWTIFSIHTVKTFIYFSFGITQELYHWTPFLSWIAISSYTGRFWWMVFRPSLLYQLRFTVSFGTSMILVQNIACGPFTILSQILSQEWNLKDTLGKQMILKLFGINGSIITLLLGKLLVQNDLQ
jgi:hypothetical protein